MLLAALGKTSRATETEFAVLHFALTTLVDLEYAYETNRSAVTSSATSFHDNFEGTKWAISYARSNG